MNKNKDWPPKQIVALRHVPWSGEVPAKRKRKAKLTGGKTAFAKSAYEHIDDKRHQFESPWGYNTHAPHTTFDMANDTPELLLSLGTEAIKLYLRCLSRLKRNQDVLISCSITLELADVQDIMGKTSYNKALRVLTRAGLIRKDPDSSLVVIAPRYVNNLSPIKKDI
jgi:hypothetical protein